MTATPDMDRPRSPRPQPGAPRPYHFPRFERRTLSNGLQLVVAPVAKLPIVTVLALLDAGSASDPAGREGVAQLTARLLLEGTARQDGVALTNAFERLGAAADAYADWDVAVLRLTALADRLPAAMRLFGEVLREPAFHERELERLKGERLSDLLQLRADPGGLAHHAMQRAFYATGSRYARPDGGTEQSVAAITRPDVVAFYDARYRAASVTLVVAGDIGVDEAVRLAEDTLGGWTGEPATPARVIAEPARRERAVHLVHKAEAPQSELRIGHVGIPRNHPDYFPVVVMNAVLGGLFSSRINMNLREAHGYTYGAFSGFDWRRQAGPFAVDAAVRTDATADAVREVLAEIDRMRAAEIDEAERSLATSYLDGVFPIRYETTDAIASALANLVIHGLPDDWLDRYRERVRAVTTADVLEAAHEHLHPEQLQVVAVGDAAVIREPLEALALGPVLEIPANEL
jgi:zinc protease